MCWRTFVVHGAQRREVREVKESVYVCEISWGGLSMLDAPVGSKILRVIQKSDLHDVGH